MSEYGEEGKMVELLRRENISRRLGTSRVHLLVRIDGNLVKGYVNGKQYLAYRLSAPVSGKVGLWTKADSVVYFDDFTVTGR